MLSNEDQIYGFQSDGSKNQISINKWQQFNKFAIKFEVICLLLYGPFSIVFGFSGNKVILLNCNKLLSFSRCEDPSFLMYFS